MASVRAQIALFDFGNVIVRWSPARLYERLFADPVEAERFLAEIDWPHWHLRHDAGEHFADTSPALIARFPHYKAPIEAWFGRWEEMFDGYVPGVVDILQELKAAGVPLYGLSNLSAEIAERTFAMFPAMALFDDIVVSGAERMIKPDPAIYELTLKRMGARSRDVFFTDDAPANIATAQALGFQAHLFTDAKALRSTLQKCGLLGN